MLLYRQKVLLLVEFIFFMKLVEATPGKVARISCIYSGRVSYICIGILTNFSVIEQAYNGDQQVGYEPIEC